MRFFEVVLSGAALVSAVLAAQVEFNSWPNSVKAGQAITLTYSPKDAATTIILKKGLSTDLKTVETITSTSTGGSFTWTIPSNLENGDDYAFEIQQVGSEKPNYTGQFDLSGGVASAVSSSAYSTKASSSAASTVASTEASSTVKTVITSAASASASIVPSHGANSTISTGTLSATKSLSGSGKPTGTSPPVENTGAASSFGVNAAALFGAMGALAYFA